MLIKMLSAKQANEINMETVSQPLTNIEVDEILADLKTPEENQTGWRIQNQKMMLTYKHHIDKDLLKEFIESTVKTNLIAFYCAHESGLNDPIQPYDHTHAVIDIGKRFQSRNCRIFDIEYQKDDESEIETIHPNISFIVANQRGSVAANWKRACKYICKEDTTVILNDRDVFTDDDVVNQIWRYTNLTDALSNMKNLKDAVSTIAVFNAKKLDWGREIDCVIKNEEDMFPWQQSLFKYSFAPPNDRSVCWIADKEGCKGKNQFIKYMNINYPGKCCWIVPAGRGTDIIHVFMEQIKNGWRGDTIIINLSRSATSSSDMDHVYRVIEDLKDGMIYSVKYAGGALMMPSPHVVVMSNTLPNLDKLTYDRWIIYNLENLELNRLSIDEVKSLKPKKNEFGKNDPFA